MEYAIRSLLGTIMVCLSIVVNAQDSLWLKENQMASEAYRQGKYPELIAQLQDKGPTLNDHLFEIYIRSLIKLKDLESAEKISEIRLKSGGHKSLNSILLSLVYQEQQKPNLANNLLNQLIVKLPAEPFAISQLAELFYNYQYYDWAIKSYEHGRKLLKQPEAFSYELITLYRITKNKGLMAQEYVDILPAMPQLIMAAKSNMAQMFESNADYQRLEAALLDKLKRHPQEATYHELLLWSYIQTKAYELAWRHLLSMEKQSLLQPREFLGYLQSFSAQGAYTAAIKGLEYMLSKGPHAALYIQARVEWLNTKVRMLPQSAINIKEVSELAQGYESILQQYGANAKTLFALKNYAKLQALYLKQPEKAIASLEKILKIPDLAAPDMALAKLDLADLYVLNNQAWEALLILDQIALEYDQQDLAQEALYKSARLSFYLGQVSQSKALLNNLKRDAANLIANDALNLSLLISDFEQEKADSLALKYFAHAGILEMQQQYPQALKLLDTAQQHVQINQNLIPSILMQKAEIKLKQQDYPAAGLIYTDLLEKSPQHYYADDALFRLAKLYADQLNRIAEAQKLYETFLQNYPGSMLVPELRKNYRSLRDVP